ncbi:MAG TPA: replicative DNA helicase [Saprospiraceae bacterium]|nr:replicative DNA helicase [Saprospiraceae bacterium]
MSNDSPFNPSGGFTKTRKSNKNTDLSELLYSKLTPQAVPFEEAVLGAAMIDKDAFAVVLDILKEQSFYLNAHQHIYRAMLRLFDKLQPIDLLTVTEELRNEGNLEKIGGPVYLVELTNKITSSANIEYHSRIIAQKHILRELIRTSNDVIKNAYDETIDVFDLLDSAEKNLFEIAQHNMSRGSERVGSIASETLKKLESIPESATGTTGVPSGFIELDKVTAGWQSSDLIIIAARPGMGKTAFTMALARNAAMDFNKPVAFFSLEMSNMQLVQRLISGEAEIEGSKLRTGRLEDSEWNLLHRTIERLADVPLFIDDTPGINIFELRAKCRRLKSQHDIQMVIIDYLQLISGGTDNTKNGNREQEISGISRALKGMAKELNIPVIALSQLNRSVEKSATSKRPQLSDLRESGAIEQDADIVSFIYRPEYYKITEDEEGNDTRGLAEIIIAKHRNGALETVKLAFKSEFAKFADWTGNGFADVGYYNDFQSNAQSDSMRFNSRMNDDNEDPF